MEVDWRSLFAVDTPFLELIIRGTVMYFALLLAMRFLVRRHIGSLNLVDLLLVVLIADAAQNGMSNEYRSITCGVILCGTLFFWDYVLDWLAFHSKLVSRILEPSPLPLVRNGQLIRRNMRQEFVTEDEILSQLREQQITDLRTVRLAYLEPDGDLSVQRFTERKSAKGSRKHLTPGAGG